MIIPSIDIRNGNAVQLIGGKEQVIDAGDPRPIAERFGRVGEIAVIDLDAAMGTGDNAGVIEELLEIAPCRVGGGIRSVDRAIRWLDKGAQKVILGTSATPEVLSELPKERVIAALDAKHGEVVVEGWTKGTGTMIESRLDELRDMVGGFLVTFVETEGRMTGFDEARIHAIVDRAGPTRVTVAGGVRSPGDVALADALGADAQVGMALYSGAFDLAEGFTAPLRSVREDGLWATVVTDERGVVLGLVYSDLESVRAALDTGRGVYHSRSRGGLWIKGESSGDTQDLIGIRADCDRDALVFRVRQRGGGFCHTGTRTCFGADSGLGRLERTLRSRVGPDAPGGSYTRRLAMDDALLANKLHEEVDELLDASDQDHAAREAADVLYFTLVGAISRGASLESIERELDRRALRVTRRPGDAKPGLRRTR